MQKNPACMKVLLWIGVALFLLAFFTFSIAPERILPALGLLEHHGFIPRLYGIFQLSWAILFFFALKDIEKNMAIINAGIVTGALVIVFLMVYQFAKVKAGWFLLLGAAILLIYTVLLFLCRPKPARP